MILLCLSLSLAVFTGNYPTGAADDGQTVEVKNNRDLGSCSCDLTLNSCDPSCCCDTDCPQAVLDLWLSDSDAFCDTLVDDSIKPLTKCVDRNILFRWNKRMGLQMSENKFEDEFCVESDKASQTTTFFDYRTPDVNQNQLLDEYFKIKSESATDEESVRLRAYFTGDLIDLSSTEEGTYMRMIGSQFGRCNFMQKARFGEDVSGSCQIKFENGAQCEGNLNLNSYAT